MNPIQSSVQPIVAQFDRTTLLKRVHDHPKFAKVARVALLILGGALIVVAATIETTTVFSLSLIGAVAVTAALLNYLFLTYASCSRHEMKNHVYKPQEYFIDGQRVGNLHYKGDTPVLELTTENPFDAGEAHGYLLAPQIDVLRERFNAAVHTVMRKPRPSEVSRLLREIKRVTPERFLIELEGLAYGYNKWAREHGKKSKVYLDDLLLIHLAPEAHHFHMRGVETRYKHPKSHAAACTTILNGPVCGRNMDWFPFGNAGKYSLMIVWKAKQIALVSIPGMIGAITGFSPHLFAAMNVCPGKTETVRGMPAVFFNRNVLEKAKSIDDVDLKGGPLGPYHLTLADKTGRGKCISFYNDRNRHFVRKASSDPLVTLNWTYPEHQGNVFNSIKRNQILTEYFKKAKRIDPSDATQGALMIAPYVNSAITVHSVLVNMKKGVIGFGFDNGFAASQPKQQHTIDSFFRGSSVRFHRMA